MVTTPDGGADSASASSAPHTHVSLVIKSAVVLLGMTALLNLYSTQPILGDIAVWAHISTTNAAWTISTTTAAVAITAPFAGMLSDRIGRRRVILAAVAAMAVLSVAALTSWSYPALVGFALLFQQVAPFTFASLTLTHPPFDLSTSTIGLIFVVFLIPTVTTPRFGALMDKWGPRRPFFASQSVSVGGLALTLFPTIPAVIIGLALSCVGVFAGQGAGTLMVGRLAAGARSTGVGLYLTGYYVGGAIGGVAPISFYSAAGWGAVVLVVLGVVLCAKAMGWWAWRPCASQVTHGTK